MVFWFPFWRFRRPGLRRYLAAASSGDPQLQDPCSASEHHGAGEGGDLAVGGGHGRGLQRSKGRDLVNLGGCSTRDSVNDVKSMSYVEKTSMGHVRNSYFDEKL